MVHDVPCITKDECLYYRMAYIEDLDNCMDMLLKILFQYSKEHSEICFYVPSIDILYKKDDILKIYYSQDWTDWYYQSKSSCDPITNDDTTIKNKGHAEVERRGVCCLVIGENRTNKYALQLSRIVEIIKSSFVRCEISDVLNLDYNSKRCRIIAKLNNEDEEYAEVDVIEKWDPIHDGIFDDVGQDIGIHLVLKYTKECEKIIRAMLKRCYDDETTNYVFWETKKPLTIEEFCN